jgi:hypothetical protein
MSRHEINNSDDVIDSRDVIARIEELESDLETERELLADHPAEPDTPAREFRLSNIAEYEAELTALKALQAEAEGYCPDWTYGATLIRDSYFTEYARELVSDIGDLPKEIPHYIEIDWEATARNIRMDYTAVEFDGVTYWVR